MPFSEPAFVLKDLNKVYGSKGGPQFHALKDASVTLPSAVFTTIVGPSGSGKSTLLALLGLLDQPTSGELRIAGVHAADLDEPSRCHLRAKLLGFVFQAFHLMTHRTVLDNVALGGLYRGLGHSTRRNEAAERLDLVGLADKKSNLAGTLSGGERQRVAIARALIGDPPILLCDEPTGNLDSTNGRAIVEILRNLAETGTSVVVVTHDPDLANLGAFQIRVMDGRVTADG